ncbi:hypothetical protein FRC20_009630 [Serendipita sp. 405]|nr:hypothetical protein FRC20_009630 [Serendipita sp. 405]
MHGLFDSAAILPLPFQSLSSFLPTITMVFTAVATAFALLAPVLAAPANTLVERTALPIKQTVPTSGKTFYYRGCYDELKSGLHALNHDITSTLTGGLTVDSCVSACNAQGYTLAGLMNGNTCICDNAISSVAPLLSDGECNSPCTGDATQSCGGVWHYLVYYTQKRGPLPVPTTPTTLGSGDSKFVSLGCWKDTVQARTLAGESYRGDDVTPALCASFCYSKNYRLAGVEHGNECYCGQQLLNPDYAKASDCSQACAGDSTQTCGGEDRLNVYFGVDRPDVLRPKILAGTNLLNQYISVGCYSDSYDVRTFSGYTYTANDMTASSCAAKCFSRGYKFAGLELATQCWCGNSLDSSRQIDQSKCDTPCGGDSAHSCGGGLRLDVYKSLLLGWIF